MISDSSSQWNEDGKHKVTGTKYDEFYLDISGHDRRGFDKDRIHKVTHEKWDEENYDYRLFHKYTGINKHTETKYDRDGLDKDGFYKDGLDKYGFHKNGKHNVTGTNYNKTGFDKYSLHKVTGTKYNEFHFDIDGNDDDGTIELW